MDWSFCVASRHREIRMWKLGVSWCLAVLVLTLVADRGLGQTKNSATDSATDSARIQEHLSAGEFPLAIELANRLDSDKRDQWLAKISKIQMDSGAGDAAYQTAEMVGYDSYRSDALNDLSESRFGQPNEAGGQRGGITLSDFLNLIDLIQNTVAVDSWENTGTGLGTINAFPAGVYVDPTGTLKRIRTGKRENTSRVRDLARLDSGNRELAMQSGMRKISLTRLEKAAQSLAAQGKPIDSTMMNLAGIYEIKYLMMYPETGDIVIAGPAGPWKFDRDNRPVNIETGKPVLQLDDFVVCLRNAWDENGIFGCSITPRKENLAKIQQFRASGDATGSNWPKKMREILGMQDIEVYGIDPETHAARVVVEADYRMKLVGMGLDPSIPEIPSYLDRVKLGPGGKVLSTDVVLRWWFTLNYDDIVADKDRTIFAFQGTGVKLLSENEFVNNQGERIHTGKSEGPTKEFAQDFTMHFDKLADKYPVYRQMKNVFDLALVSNIIRQQKLSQKTGWHRTFFGSPVAGRVAYVVRKERAPRQVNSVMNEKKIYVRKESSRVEHRIAGVSGGVSYNVNDVLSKQMLVDAEGGELEKSSANGKPKGDEITWWWD